jgi:hypothetical protein
LFVGEVDTDTKSLDKIKGNCCEANLIDDSERRRLERTEAVCAAGLLLQEIIRQGEGNSFLLVIYNEHSGRRSCSLMFVMVLFVLNPLEECICVVAISNLPVSLLQKKVVKKKETKGDECRLVGVRMARIIWPIFFIFGWVLVAVD